MFFPEIGEWNNVVAIREESTNVETFRKDAVPLLALTLERGRLSHIKHLIKTLYTLWINIWYCQKRQENPIIEALQNENLRRDRLIHFDGLQQDCSTHLKIGFP